MKIIKKEFDYRMVYIFLLLVMLKPCVAKAEIPNDAVEWNGHSYKVYFDRETWEEAKANCEKVGGHLAVITSEEENNVIFDMIYDQEEGGYWIGLTDSTSEGSWSKWITGEEVSYDNWAYNQPDDNVAGTSHQDYVVMVNYEDSNLDEGWYLYPGEWDDWNNPEPEETTNPVGYICEWDSISEQAVQTVPTKQAVERPDYGSALNYVTLGAYTGLHVPADVEKGSAEADSALWDALMNVCEVNAYPEGLTAYYEEQASAVYRDYAAAYDLDFDTYVLVFFGIDSKEFTANLAAYAETKTQKELILTAIAETEGLELTDDEYETGCEQYAERRGYRDVASLAAAEGEGELHVQLLMEKTWEMIADNAIYGELDADVELVAETGVDSEVETEIEPDTEPDTTLPMVETEQEEVQEYIDQDFLMVFN